MKFFELNIATLVLRFYLLMALVIVSFFIGQYWLSILALPIFLSALMGIRFSTKKKEAANIKLSKMNSVQFNKTMKYEL